MRTVALVLAALALAAPARGQDGLAAAQALYTTAQYEDALKAFDALKPSSLSSKAALAVEQGRAFCLLALDRKPEAERSIEAIVGLDPFYKPTEDETPPKIRTAFRDVRRKVLPGVLQSLYEGSKAAYDRKTYNEAVAGFTLVLSLLDDPDLVLDAGPRADMRLIARAFSDLAKAAAAPPPPPQTPEAPSGASRDDRSAASGGQPSVATNPSAPSPGGSAPKVGAVPLYDAASKDVTPPVPVKTDVTIPMSVRRSLPGGEVFVELVVSTTGSVESATARQAPNSVLGALVATSALDWRYRPATRAGTPVRYRLIAKVVVSQ
jgi:hypothetical protein